MSTRRAFIKTGAGIAGGLALSTVVPASLRGQLGTSASSHNDPQLKALLLRGLDAAKSAGAQYADVRFTYTMNRTVNPSILSDGEELCVGIRALVNGYWGFAASPVLTNDELVRLGRSATFQAQTNALGKKREIDLAPVTGVSDGRWIMPVKVDPFSVHPLAIQDYLGGLQWQIYYESELGRGEYLGIQTEVSFVVQERAFGTTDGTYLTQRVYRTDGSADMQLSRISSGSRVETRGMDMLSPAGVGWELFTEQPVLEHAFRLVRDMQDDLSLPLKPIEPGRFDTVVDAQVMASLVSQSIGMASELDRALGYEANASGTSYLNDPLGMLDTFTIGSPLLTVTANRSEPGGAATMKWDDEGATPQPFTVVERGVLRNYHYTREGAGWLRASGVQRPFASLGVAYASSADCAAIPRTANLVLAPGKDDADEETLIAQVGKGIAVQGGAVGMDFQQRNGTLSGRMYEIKNGKRIARLGEAYSLFNTMKLWKNLTAIGGPGSVRRFGTLTNKGEPMQSAYNSVTTCPATFKDVTLIDPQKR